MPISEANILKPLDPSNTNSDDWPTFVLSNAQVVYESNGKRASLLSAYADQPLRVVGRLEVPERPHTQCLLKKPYTPVDVEIRRVTRFSYGELTDGTFVIWAQGEAGWFEIQPAAHYKPIFDEMMQAVALLYFLTDVYSQPRKRGGGLSAQLVYQEYAEDERFACSDPADAEKIFRQHLVFLIMCFLNRAQGIGWSNTPIYQHFRKKHSKIFEACKARAEGRLSQKQSQGQTRTAKSSPAPPPKSANPNTKSPAVHGKSRNSKLDQAPKRDDNWWEAAALFEFIQKAVNQHVLRAGRNQITLSRVAELVVRRYEVEDLETAQSVLLVHAQNLCYMMDHPRRQSIRFFATEPIYQELSAGHNLSAADQRRAEAVQLRPRRDHATLRDGESDSSNTSDDEEEDTISTPLRRAPRRRRKGRLSVLRPKSGKSSAKSEGKSIKGANRKAGKGKAPFPDSEDLRDDSQDDQSEDSSSEDLLGIDTPTQALSPSREKRKHNETDDDEDQDMRRRKRAASASIIILDSPPTTSGSDDEDEQERAEEDEGPPLPLRYRPTTVPSASRSLSKTKPAVIPSIISTPLPTYEPNGPRDSWICSFDGCSQRIYGCSKEIGRQLITEHLEDHVKGREKVVGILWREQNKLHLPVNNLIKKIREMSEASTPLFPMSGTSTATQLQPIQRAI